MGDVFFAPGFVNPGDVDESLQAAAANKVHARAASSICRGPPIERVMSDTMSPKASQSKIVRDRGAKRINPGAERVLPRAERVRSPFTRGPRDVTLEP